MSIIANKNFVFNFLFVSAIIALPGVFLVDDTQPNENRTHSTTAAFQTYNYEHQTVATPSVLPHYVTLFSHSFVIVCSQMKQWHHPFVTSALLVLCSYLSFVPPTSLYPAINPIALSTQSCHTKREISFPFLNSTEHLDISGSVRISIQMFHGALFLVSFHFGFDTFTQRSKRGNNVFLVRTLLLLSRVPTSE